MSQEQQQEPPSNFYKTGRHYVSGQVKMRLRGGGVVKVGIQSDHDNRIKKYCVFHGYLKTEIEQKVIL